jgi:hypothetical protein
MTLKPIDETFLPPQINDANDLFEYLAAYNGFSYYETDLNGVVPNEIAYALFMVNRIDLVTPINSTKENRHDGFLFMAIPSEIGTDVNQSTFDAGQFENIIKDMISNSFINQLRNYVICGVNLQFTINNIRPLYNSVKYTKSTNTTGVEISYSLWI